MEKINVPVSLCFLLGKTVRVETDLGYTIEGKCVAFSNELESGSGEEELYIDYGDSQNGVARSHITGLYTL